MSGDARRGAGERHAGEDERLCELLGAAIGVCDADREPAVMDLPAAARRRQALLQGARARAGGGASSGRFGRRSIFGLGAAVGAAAVAVLFVFARPHRAPMGAANDGRFVARGAPIVKAPEVYLYRLRPGDRAPEPVVAAVGPEDELAFAYRNLGQRARLLLFGVDEHGHVYWYHPEWSRPADDPAAVPISTDPGLHELPAAIAQRYDGDALMVHAVFTDNRLTVRGIEAAVAAAGAEGRGVEGWGQALPLPGATDVVVRLRILR